MFAHAKAEPSSDSNRTGRQIDVNDEQPEKANAPISKSCELCSNVNVESERQPLKQHFPRTSTDAGM
jgi:hypothetical protein